MYTRGYDIELFCFYCLVYPMQYIVMGYMDHK